MGNRPSHDGGAREGWALDAMKPTSVGGLRCGHKLTDPRLNLGIPTGHPRTDRRINMKFKLDDLKERNIPVVFGPRSNPDKFRIDLLERSFRILSLENYSEIGLEMGIRLGESPYSHVGRTYMPPSYLCEGSIWLNFINHNGDYANMSLISFLDSKDDHHNFYLWWENFDGTQDYCKDSRRIPGHQIPTDEPIEVKITFDEKIIKGTIDGT